MTWTIGCNHGNMWISWIFGFRMIRKVGFSLGFSLSKWCRKAMVPHGSPDQQMVSVPHRTVSLQESDHQKIRVYIVGRITKYHEISTCPRPVDSWVYTILYYPEIYCGWSPHFPGDIRDKNQAAEGIRLSSWFCLVYEPKNSDRISIHYRELDIPNQLNMIWVGAKWGIPIFPNFRPLNCAKIMIIPWTFGVYHVQTNLCVKLWPEDIPSGKRSHITMDRSTMLLMGSHQLFRLGHFLCRKLWQSLPEAGNTPGSWKSRWIFHVWHQRLMPFITITSWRTTEKKTQA